MNSQKPNFLSKRFFNLMNQLFGEPSHVNGFLIREDHVEREITSLEEIYKLPKYFRRVPKRRANFTIEYCKEPDTIIALKYTTENLTPLEITVNTYDDVGNIWNDLKKVVRRMQEKKLRFEVRLIKKYYL